MEVILKEDFAALGFIGDMINVKRGYARNFLLPRGLAIEANPNNERQLKHSLNSINSKKIKLRGEAEKLAEDIKTKSLSFTLKSGENGKIFGSVTNRDIEAELAKHGFVIDRRRIRLSEPLRRAGVFDIEVRLHSDVSVSFPVDVKIELIEEKADSTEQEQAEGRKPRRSSRSKKVKQDDDEKVGE